MKFINTLLFALLLFSRLQADFTPPLQLSTEPDANSQLIVANSSGHAMAVWAQADPNTGNSVIVASFYNGTSWSDVVTLSDNSTTSFLPAVALDEHDNAVAAWYFGFGVSFTVRASRFTKGSWHNTGPDSVTLSEHPTESGGLSISIGIDAKGRSFAVWVDVVDMLSTVAGAAFNAKTGTVSSQKLISTEGDFAGAQSIAVNEAGRGVITWVEIEGATEFVKARMVTLPEKLGSIHTLAADATEMPSVGIDKHGNANISWVINSNVLQAAIFNGTVGPTTTIFVGTSVVEENKIAVNASGEAMLLFVDFEGGIDVVRAAHFKNGVWTLFPNPISIPTANAREIDVAIDDLDNAIAVWEFGNSAPHQVQVATFNGTVWAAPFTISDPAHDAEFPHVAFGATNEAFVIWQYTDLQAVFVSIVTNPNVPGTPTGFRGHRIRNEFLVEIDVIHRLRWNGSVDTSIIEYQLFRNGFLIATILNKGQAVFFYNDHGRKRHVDTYELFAVNQNGRSEIPAVTVVP